jgi:hypothetical protein
MSVGLALLLLAFWPIAGKKDEGCPTEAVVLLDYSSDMMAN